MLRRLREERGQELVEYALVLPLLLLLIFGILQFVLVMMAYNTLGDAAREGARLGVIADNADYPSRIEAVVYDITDAAGMARADLTVDPVKTADAETNGFIIQVEVTYDMDLFVPVVTPPHIPLRAVSTKLIEVG